jgi:hypothetical protein
MGNEIVSKIRIDRSGQTYKGPVIDPSELLTIRNLQVNSNGNRSSPPGFLYLSSSSYHPSHSITRVRSSFYYPRPVLTLFRVPGFAIMAQQSPSAAGDENAALMQYIGGQFEEGTNAAEGGNTANIAVDLQHLPTIEEHGFVQSQEELTSNTAIATRRSNNQDGPIKTTSNEMNDDRNGNQSAASMSGLQARRTRTHVEQPGAIQSSSCTKADLASR